jgi:ABC-2 type transport system permease protein
MTTFASAVSDSATMIRRQLLHMLRYPSLTMFAIGIPVVLLVLFVYIFGATLGAGLAHTAGSHGGYVQYVTPGILMIALSGAATGTAISIAMDMTENIIARFRTMAISRASILIGHVVGSMIQTTLVIAAVIGVALLIGFRATAGPVEWLEAVGVMAMAALAVTWLGIALGLASKTVELASNLPMPLTLLPFLGSGFVPTGSMPAAVRWFADYQPFTPIMETLRGLLMGAPIGKSAVIAVAWCAAITVGAFIWAVALLNREPGAVTGN